jgi:hypothetical protein
MVGGIISGCLRHGEFDRAVNLVKDFAGSGARRNNAMVSIDTLLEVAEALGAAEKDTLGQVLLECLRQRRFPSAQLSQCQSALAEGSKLRSGGGASTGAHTDGSAVASAALASASGATYGDAAVRASDLAASAVGYWPHSTVFDAMQNAAYGLQTLPPYMPGAGFSPTGYYGDTCYQHPDIMHPTAAHYCDAYGALAYANSAHSVLNSLPHKFGAVESRELTPVGTDASARSPQIFPALDAASTVAAAMNVAATSIVAPTFVAKENVVPLHAQRQVPAPKEKRDAPHNKQRDGQRDGAAKPKRTGNGRTKLEVRVPQPVFGHLGA